MKYKYFCLFDTVFLIFIISCKKAPNTIQISSPKVIELHQRLDTNGGKAAFTC